MYRIQLIAIFVASANAVLAWNPTGDTNRIDLNNLKQGYWVYIGSMVDNPNYQPNQKVEEGTYADDRKKDIWVTYFPNQEKKNEINYTNGKQNGPYKIYYKDVALQEEGVWKNRRNISSFKRYHPNDLQTSIKEFRSFRYVGEGVPDPQ